MRQGNHLVRIEVRDALPAIAPDVVSYVSGVHHQLALAQTVDESFAALSPDHRRAVRIAGRAGLDVEVGTSRSLFEAFARLHAVTRKRLGVPIQPRRFVRALGVALAEGDLGFIVVVRHNDHPVAAGVFLTGHGMVLFKYSASDADAWKLRPNNLMVWEAIRRSVERGFVRFDLGRSDVGQDGLCFFKRNFGAAELPLVYTSIGTHPRAPQVRPGRLSHRVIQRSPLFVGRVVGRALYRYVA
jgi:lipid II:glycine glycyltransferase (peptidoglycan interpeptide bridge formation enzyme)